MHDKFARFDDDTALVGFFDEVVEGFAGFARRFYFVGNAPDGEFARAAGEDDFGV